MRSSLIDHLIQSPALARPRQFGMRLLISLLVIGILYLGGVTLYRHQRYQTTPSQKLATLRAGLEQTVLSGSRLASFSDTNSVAGTTLSQAFATYQASVRSLTQQASAAPIKQLSDQQRNALQSIINTQQRATSSYKSVYQTLGQPLSYDPFTDLANLSIPKDSPKIITRARAAQKGLTSNLDGTVASSKDGLTAQAGQAPTTVANSQTQAALVSAATCFGALADQLQVAKQSDASQTRQRCLQSYPAVRAQIIHNILQLSFNQQYLNDTQNTALPLLKQLDAKLVRNY
jgi:hypothetical protein